MSREITTGTREVLDPEWDDVSRIIDFGNCWDNDVPTGDNYYPIRIGYDPYKRWSAPIVAPLQKPKPKPKPKPQPKPVSIITGQQKMLWWRHEMQEISEEVLARIYDLDQVALHDAIRHEWAMIYEFWGGTPEEFRAEMRKLENIDKHRA